ncbi:uncharacterized protein B0H18DRAFT_1208606 [Fomitopsis serialis]|uniref:uncharacterized protein n=1 Tax=Fomitopsis serialis TaxID=139415 RepID=UPI0020071E8B|nr:uncharacterized protein B0H18DRAFT_1208606 [Neoantrodia serialis]KAH9932320.1 hypothetical protein B0H18DRAFT_1208606 [Neoantrodia serialis]
MNSLFASNRILPSLKRRSRVHSKSETLTTPTRGTSLEILPELEEEEEAQARPSCSSTHSAPAHAHKRSNTPSHLCINVGDAAERKRSSRRVVLTGAEGLTFEDFFPACSAPKPPRPAPAPPLYDAEASRTASPMGESPLDSIDLRFSGLGISLDFPSPPLERVSISASPSQSPLAARRRGHSPTPSVASTVTSHTSSSSGSSAGFSSPRLRRELMTPPTSDDDSLPATPTRPHLMRAPTCKSHRASVLFAKSMPDLSKSSAESDGESDVESDVEWYARDISDVVTLSTPLPPSFPAVLVAPTSKDPKARPDSIMPLKRSRLSKPLPTVPRLSIQTADAPAKTSPSAQLDPTFMQARRRRSFLIPDRPPPPPPIRITPCASSSSPPTSSSLSPTASEMEACTEELLAELASAALNSGFLGTGFAAPHTPGPWSAGTTPTTPSSAFFVPHSASSSRPLPRMSLPTDIWDDLAEDEAALPELVVDASVSPEPATPQSVSVYSQPSNGRSAGSASPASSFSFDVDVSFVDGSSTPVVDADLPAAPDSPGSDAPAFEQERVLRSRWSSSTLGSQVQAEREAFGWISRLTLSPTKKASAARRAPPSPSPKSPTKTMSAFVLQSPRSPTRPANTKRYGYVDSPASGHGNQRGLERRGSSVSRMSESSADSGCSSRSEGLRRKPIPVEMFIRT